MPGKVASAIPTQPEFFIHVSSGYRIRKSGPFNLMIHHKSLKQAKYLFHANTASCLNLVNIYFLYELNMQQNTQGELLCLK